MNRTGLSSRARLRAQDGTIPTSTRSQDEYRPRAHYPPEVALIPVSTRLFQRMLPIPLIIDVLNRVDVVIRSQLTSCY